MRIIYVVVMALMSTPSLVPVAAAQTPRPAPTTSPPATTAPAPAVAERADRLLKEMGAYIGSAQQFTFHADIIFDHVLPSGQKLQFSASEDVALQRPGGLYVEWSGDLGDRQFCSTAPRSLCTIHRHLLLERSGAARDRRHAGQADDTIGLFPAARRLPLS